MLYVQEYVKIVKQLKRLNLMIDKTNLSNKLFIYISLERNIKSLEKKNSSMKQTIFYKILFKKLLKIKSKYETKFTNSLDYYESMEPTD